MANKSKNKLQQQKTAPVLDVYQSLVVLALHPERSLDQAHLLHLRPLFDLLCKPERIVFLDNSLELPVVLVDLTVQTALAIETALQHLKLTYVVKRWRMLWRFLVMPAPVERVARRRYIEERIELRPRLVNRLIGETELLAPALLQAYAQDALCQRCLKVPIMKIVDEIEHIKHPHTSRTQTHTSYKPFVFQGLDQQGLHWAIFSTSLSLTHEGSGFDALLHDWLKQSGYFKRSPSRPVPKVQSSDEWGICQTVVQRINGELEAITFDSPLDSVAPVLQVMQDCEWAMIAWPWIIGDWPVAFVSKISTDIDLFRNVIRTHDPEAVRISQYNACDNPFEHAIGLQFGEDDGYGIEGVPFGTIPAAVAELDGVMPWMVMEFSRECSLLRVGNAQGLECVAMACTGTNSYSTSVHVVVRPSSVQALLNLCSGLHRDIQELTAIVSGHANPANLIHVGYNDHASGFITVTNLAKRHNWAYLHVWGHDQRHHAVWAATDRRHTQAVLEQLRLGKGRLTGWW